MKTGKVNINYQVERELSYIQIRENLYAYRLVETIANKVVLDVEGFTRDIAISGNDKIENVRGIAFAKKEILEINKQYPGGFYVYEKKEDIVIDKPYTFLSENETYEDEYMLICIYSYSGDLKNVDTGEYYPKGIHIEYIQTPYITSYYYDLPKVLEYLKTKSNVKLLEDKVLNVPMYNRSKECKEYLEFVYIPTFEEYNELVKMDSFLRNKKCLENLGLNQFAIKHSDEEEDEEYDY